MDNTIKDFIIKINNSDIRLIRKAVIYDLGDVTTLSLYQDQKDFNYYICSCYQLDPSLEYLLCKIEDSVFLSMMHNEITLRKAFESCNECYMLKYDNDYAKDRKIIATKLDKITEDILPSDEFIFDKDLLHLGGLL